MSDRSSLRFIDQLFSEEERALVYEFLSRSGWKHGWKSNSARDGSTFLHRHFGGHRNENDGVYDCESEVLLSAPPIWAAWQNIKNTVFKTHRLVRCYANGMCYGMDGTVHTDSKRQGSYTCVYYPHDRWSPNWGGETIFYNKQENGIVGCSYPRPNNAVIFDGRIPHRAAGVSRVFPGMRITLMFKTEIIDGPEPPRAAA